MSTRTSTDRVRAVYDRLADRYDRGMAAMERVARFERGRWWVGARAHGATLEVGVGTGLNLRYYGAGVTLTGIDVSPAMLARARRRAEELGLDVTLREADAEALPFSDAAFDTVVFALCLCSIPDDARAIAEAVRVLRPDGTLLFLEHVRSSLLPVRAMQRMLDPLSVRFQADHLVRRPLDRVRDAGLRVEDEERWALGAMQCASARKRAA